jgi:hypothetical protein
MHPLGMSNKTKIIEFQILAKLFNDMLNSKPILYGSLGLTSAMKIELETKDIDILLEDDIFKSQLSSIHSIMTTNGFLLVDENENTYRRGDLEVGIASDGDMLNFSGIEPSSLPLHPGEPKYRTLSIEQYLATYKASVRDGYRKELRKKDDSSKIDIIEAFLNA